MFICDNIDRDSSGGLTFAGCSVKSLAARFGTPLYLMDEDKIRQNCRSILGAVKKYFGDAGGVLYAGKAASFTRMIAIAAEEGLGLDVVSSGEIYTALKAGADMGNAFFHGNCKTDRDIACAMDSGVGYFVVDCEDELYALEEEAKRRDTVQKILLRITPGIDPHTFKAVATGVVDSKFGCAIQTGAALDMTEKALSCPHLSLEGFHCHVGSQIFLREVFTDTAAIMIGFMISVREKTGYAARILDLGGGFGVRYVQDDPDIDIPSFIEATAQKIITLCDDGNYPLPRVMLEPGRSIVADAGMSVYTVGAVKDIEGYRRYAAVDGGMTDNPRYALYGSAYTVLAEKEIPGEQMTRCDLVGRCCESGDIIQKDVPLPSSLKRWDLVAVCTTGAYNYSMASNYNRLGRPPVVMLTGGESYEAVRRETDEDLTALDL
ncbi:MAG: diaminopimelate decarboxylase [Eubacteriaceae bacterium]|nr:diaminopimelate decarboxylase [Eubacteriaceae bacterium]